MGDLGRTTEVSDGGSTDWLNKFAIKRVNRYKTTPLRMEAHGNLAPT